MNPSKSISRVVADLKNTQVLDNLGNSDDNSYDNVYICKKKGDHKRYVCKVVKKSRFNPLEFTVPIFMHNNPHFVKVHNFMYTSSGEVLFVMDYISGGDLFDMVKKGGSDNRLDEITCRKIIFTLVNALHDLHQHNIIHNDVKLENVLYDRKKKRTYICDYGLAKIINTPSCYDGTTVYYSPEKIFKQNHEPCFDWWAVGVLAYELLSSKFPFDIDENNEEELYDIEPAEMLPLYSKPLEDIDGVTHKAMDFVTKMLTLDKNKRLCTYNDIIKHEFMAW
uniref:Protein kinase-1 n=1 Tax=Erinnyis ello granulovirus TaxID=307444 RepID=A0A288WIH2_9BBAC|nr:protein kinase-1 [Erinnyis ello granulovirus]ARX71992.1 protein kinase-1 [Erinnyis ello granulovirus]